MATELGVLSPGWARPYRSARHWAVVTTVMLALTIVYSVVLILVAEGFFGFVADLGLGDIFLLALTVAGVIVNIGDLIAFLFWFARAYRNLPALAAQELEWSPRSAVLWWFVPLANLVVPLLITCEIWKGSEPSIIPNTRYSRGAAKFPVALILWWVAWWGARLTSGLRTSSDDAAFVPLTALLIVAALLAIAVIWSIQLRQDRRVGG